MKAQHSQNNAQKVRREGRRKEASISISALCPRLCPVVVWPRQVPCPLHSVWSRRGGVGRRQDKDEQSNTHRPAQLRGA